VSSRSRNHRIPAESPRENSSVDDAELFFAEVADAKPLADRDRRPPPRPERKRRAEPAADVGRALSLELTREGELAWARASGVSQRQLADLRAGRLEPEATLDLHGFSAAEAGDRADAFIAESVTRGRRCVLVISGRGRKSQGISVVKDEVLERLTRGRSARSVRALSTAQPRHGGPGALYVALKRA
jgi:DNA-nicking Smr family endonuclease